MRPSTSLRVTPIMLTTPFVFARNEAISLSLLPKLLLVSAVASFLAMTRLDEDSVTVQFVILSEVEGHERNSTKIKLGINSTGCHFDRREKSH